MQPWIASDDALNDYLARHADAVNSGLDTEFMRVDTFYPKLALVQINLDGETALVDPLALGGLSALGARLSDPQRLNVMHSASEDLEAFAAVLPQGLGALFDTQIAAAMTGYGLGLSYQKLVAAITGVELTKAETRSDWLKRPLTPEQLEYAAQDVIHLPALHAELGERLERLGRSAWHAEDCARMIERARRRDGDPEPQRGIKSAAEWPRERQALLRRVLRWRDVRARQLDVPRPWLVDDARAVQFVLEPPADAEALYQAAKGLRALRGAQRTELLQVLQRPLEPEELEFAPIAPLPGPREKKLIGCMKDKVNALAAELDLPEGVLCARRHLEALVFERTWPEALDGWRRSLLHDRLMACLA